MKSAGTISFILLLLFLTHCKKEETIEATKKEIDTVYVKSLPVVNSSYKRYGDYYGVAEPQQHHTLISFLGGTVEKIAVSEGDKVRKGQSLVLVNSKKAQLMLETARLNEEVARSLVERTKKQLESGNSTKNAYNKANLSWLQSKDVLINAEKNLRGAQGIAPFSGIVLNKYVEQYQEIPPQMKTLSIGNVDKIKVIVFISEHDVVSITEGGSCSVTFNNIPSKVWEGKVYRLSRDTHDKKKMYRCEVIIDNRKRELLPGFTANVKVLLKEDKERVIIPTSAILTTRDKQYVMILKNNKAIKTFVTVETVQKEVSVIAHGLKVGDTIITEGNHMVNSDSFVLVSNKKS